MTGETTSKKTKRIMPKGMIGFQDMTPEEHRKIAVAGGKANKNNPRSKIAARLREMKKKGLNKESEKMMYEMMTDSVMSEFYVLEFVQKILLESDNVKDINAAVNTAMNWHKLKHGTKEHNKTVQLAVTVLTPEERQNTIYRIIGKEDKS